MFLVDVGCGTGWFIKYWLDHDKGYAIGIEPSKQARDNAPFSQKPFMFESLLSLEETSPGLFYDQIYEGANVHMALVLEHIPDPAGFLSQYIPFLGNGGNLMVVVPNEFSPLQERLNTKHFVSPVHVNYFNRDSLTNVALDAFGKRGHRSVWCYFYATFPFELFELMGYHYIGNEEKGRKLHSFRLHFEKALGVTAFRIYTYLFEKHGWGREIIMVAKGACNKGSS
jgi:SAM-dependent methyltransferase